jgi:DNA-binding IclR family transcriptional regulator
MSAGTPDRFLRADTTAEEAGLARDPPAPGFSGRSGRTAGVFYNRSRRPAHLPPRPTDAAATDRECPHASRFRRTEPVRMSEDSGKRIVRLINFFAAHPTESFTLSEIVDHLSLSLGSAHRVLKTLTDARYLSRHPQRKTYSLGLALVAVGQAALERHPAVALARDEMAKLTDELGLQCVATARVGDELMSLAKSGDPPAEQGIRHVGERRPFVPPLGLGHAAWSTPAQVDAYLAKVASPGPARRDAEMRAHMQKSLAAIRDRGYALAANGPAMKSVWQLIWDYAAHFQSERYWAQMHRVLGALSNDELQLLSLDGVGNVRLAYISAPVFSAGGEVLLSISMSGFTRKLDARAVARLAERVCNAAAQVTSASGGRAPRGG